MNARLLQGGWLAAAVAVLLLVLWAALPWCRRRRRAERWSAVAVFLTFGAIYALSSVAVRGSVLNASHFPHYARLAEALLHGRLDLQEPLFELASREGRLFVMEPIAPAIFMLPFVAIWGRAFSDVCFLIVVGAVNAALVFTLWPKIAAWDADRVWPADGRFWLTVLFALGTPHWYLAVAGRVWHTQGLVALGCLLIAMHEALGRGRVASVHAWLGLAFLSHESAVLSLPFFWLVCGERLRRAGKPWPRIMWSLGGGAVVLGLLIAVGWGWYNHFRFGHWFESGLTQEYLSDVARGVCAPFGLMSVRYMPHNIWIALLRPPLPLQPQFPFLSVDYDGFSLVWATPALVYGALARRPGVLAIAAWTGLVPVLTSLLMFHHHGATQFGYRWVFDLLPFAVLLTALGMQRCRWRLARPMILASVLINFIGVIWFYASY